MNTSESFRNDVYNHIRKYTTPSWYYSILHTFVTVVLLDVCFHLNTIFAAPIFGLVLIRTFILFHDMAHDSFFPLKRLNKIFGLIFGTITFTPYSYWVNGHTYHHINSNKLNLQQHGQTAVWEKTKYLESSKWSQFIYRLFYGKYTLFTINPMIYFLIVHRIMANWYETLLQIIYVIFLYMYLDTTQYLYFGLSIWFAGMFGFILFHIQHTFDNAYRAHDHKQNQSSSTSDNLDKSSDTNEDTNNDNWKYFSNGMYGSSFIQVPFILKLFTCNIQYHHIHHLNSKVPFYYLDQCHNEGEEFFRTVNKVYIKDIIKSLKYSIYNLKEKKFEDVYDY